MAAPSTHLRPRPATAPGTVDLVDEVAARVHDAVSSVIAPGPARDALQGRWLGTPLHPVLTDLPIGFFTSATTLDLLAGRHARRATRRLVGLGVLSVVPTALSGWAEYADAPPGARRTGIVHAGINGVGALAYYASWRARRRGHHLRGIALGLVGGAVLSVGAHLGGKLIAEHGMGVVPDRDEGPGDAAGPTLEEVPRIADLPL